MDKLLLACAIFLLSHVSGRTNAVNPTHGAGSSDVSSIIDRLKIVNLDIKSLERILKERRDEGRLLWDLWQAATESRPGAAPLSDKVLTTSEAQQMDGDVDRFLIQDLDLKQQATASRPGAAPLSDKVLTTSKAQQMDPDVDRFLLLDLDERQQASTKPLSLTGPEVTKAAVSDNASTTSVARQTDPDVDYLTLSLYWDHYFRQFFINGLWPSSLGPKNPERCKDYSRDNNPAWIRNMIPVGIERKWKLWPGELSNEQAWRQQWKQYGTCTYKLPGFGSIRKYYENTIKLFDNLYGGGAFEPTFEESTSRNRRVNREFVISELFPATLNKNIKEKGEYMQLVCEKKRLVEVRFCYKADPFTEHIKCPKIDDSCGDLFFVWLEWD